MTRDPVLVSTVLGSCVAVTMFSASRGFGAICHAMLPENAGKDLDLRYVDTALQHLHRKVVECNAGGDLVVKLFGGAQVLDIGGYNSARFTIGEQNVSRAEALLLEYGFTISARDTGGMHGRKLFFCTETGNVYMRRMRSRQQTINGDTNP